MFLMLKERQSCKAKNNRSSIDCELGNPLQRDAQVSTAAQCCHCEHHGLYCHNVFSTNPLQVTFYIMLTTNHILPNTKAVNVSLRLMT